MQERLPEILIFMRITSFVCVFTAMDLIISLLAWQAAHSAALEESARRRIHTQHSASIAVAGTRVEEVPVDKLLFQSDS